MTATEGPPVFEIVTNGAMLAAFDPVLLRDKSKEPGRWWSAAPLATPERLEGKLALWPLGGREGRYRVRLATGLTEVEAAFDRGASAAAPLRIESGEVFVGPAERIPGDGFGYRLSRIPDGGEVMPLPAGSYAVRVHVLDWRPDERFWDEENEPLPDAPPDLVVLVEPTAAPPAAPAAVAPLTDLLPKKEAKGSERVVRSTRPRAPIVLEDEKKKPAKARGPREPRAPRAAGATTLRVAPGKPGELRVGAQVRHAAFGVGEVLFVREGFPKAKVRFHGVEEKVDRDELTVLD